jgi:vacuole morphology and inheritance protein 14
VRYYACESLYNIAKASRERFAAAFFPEAFDALFRLCADPDPGVQSAVAFLDGLIKVCDYVLVGWPRESGVYFSCILQVKHDDRDPKPTHTNRHATQDIVTASPSFSVDAFVPRLRDYMRVANPYKRQFLVSWVAALESVPDLDLLAYLPELLDGLFGLLGDPNRCARAVICAFGQQRDGTKGKWSRQSQDPRPPPLPTPPSPTPNPYKYIKKARSAWPPTRSWSSSWWSYRCRAARRSSGRR